MDILRKLTLNNIYKLNYCIELNQQSSNIILEMFVLDNLSQTGVMK